MRFIVALLIASLFVDKADSELSFIPRHNLYPCALYSPGVRSQKYSHPYPLTSIPRASYPLSFDHGGEANKNGKTHIALGLGIIRLELMTYTTSRWHSTTELYPYFHLKRGTFCILLISENLAIDRGVSTYIYNQNGFLLFLVEVMMNKKVRLPVIL